MLTSQLDICKIGGRYGLQNALYLIFLFNELVVVVLLIVVSYSFSMIGDLYCFVLILLQTDSELSDYPR